MDSVVTCIAKQGDWLPNMLPFVLLFKHRQIKMVCTDSEQNKYLHPLLTSAQSVRADTAYGNICRSDLSSLMTALSWCPVTDLDKKSSI